MNHQDILKSIDSLIFEHTGKHLDSLQRLILEGSLNNKKYSEIAGKYKCTEGHVKDEAYELWKMLSAIIGEDIYKNNFCSTIERLGVANYHSTLIKIGNINFGNDSNEETEGINESSQSFKQEDIQSSIFEKAEKQIKLKMIPQLQQLGLKLQEIGDSLELSVDEIEEYLSNNSQSK